MGSCGCLAASLQEALIASCIRLATSPVPPATSRCLMPGNGFTFDTSLQQNQTYTAKNAIIVWKCVGCAALSLDVSYYIHMLNLRAWGLQCSSEGNHSWKVLICLWECSSLVRKTYWSPQSWQLIQVKFASQWNVLTLLSTSQKMSNAREHMPHETLS